MNYIDEGTAKIINDYLQYLRDEQEAQEKRFTKAVEENNKWEKERADEMSFRYYFAAESVKHIMTLLSIDEEEKEAWN